MKNSILLTGATGALGSMVLQRLCPQGYNVICLVRARDRGEARARVQDIVGERENVQVVCGDVTQPHCGISDADRGLLASQVKRVLHCAALVNFRDEQGTHLTNVTGVQHVLELTNSINVEHVLHVSTAYVVGDGSYLAEQRPLIGQRLRNPYETTKFLGETMVRDWAEEREERHFTIFRPSVLIGCEDGTTSTFDGHYRYFEPIHRVAESLRNHKGKTLPPDVCVENDGHVSVPLAVLMHDKRVNYVPIDWVADMIVAAVDAPARDQTYHLVHHNPIRLRDAMSWSLNHLKVNGVSMCDTQFEKDAAVKAQSPLVNRLQRRIDFVHEAYTPYCTAEPQFQMEAAPRNLGRKFRLAPVVDQQFLERTLNYVLQGHWSAKKPNGHAPF